MNNTEAFVRTFSVTTIFICTALLTQSLMAGISSLVTIYFTEHLFDL